MLALRAQARPVALALLVVMVVTLAAALEGHPVLWPFAASAAIAYAGAAAYGQSRLHATPAEVTVTGPFAAVRSVWDAAGQEHVPFVPVSSAKLALGELTVGLGDDVRALRVEDWSEFDALVSALRVAAREGEQLTMP